MIGLVDYDLQLSTSTQLLVPNLEIMKLATYYKLEENTFCRLINLNETELTGYDKIYFFSETSIAPEIPPMFLRANNVIFGGTTFTNGIYEPFENSIIDYTIAKPLIYKNFLKEKYDSGIKTKVIEHVLDDSYYRIFLNNQQLPAPPILPHKRLIIYDRDIFQNNWENILQNLSMRKPSSIKCIHPITCKTLTQFFGIRKMPKLARDNHIILDINIPLDEVYYMFKSYKNDFLADIAKTSNVFLSLGGSYKSSFQYFKDFIYKLNLLYSFWSQGIPIKIKYLYPQIGYKNPLQTISKLAATWTNGTTKDEKTLENRMTKYLSKDEATILKNEKELLLKFYPTANDLFKQNFADLKQRRYWKI